MNGRAGEKDRKLVPVQNAGLLIGTRKELLKQDYG
jgi:hypothetical protein